jgi:hypothetical protein
LYIHRYLTLISCIRTNDIEVGKCLQGYDFLKQQAIES